MKFKTFLLNEGRTSESTLDEIKSIIKKNCKKNFNVLSKSTSSIFRGIRKFHGEFGTVDSNAGDPRKSRDGHNYITLLIDNLPSWKGYPKRSRSLICTTNPLDAKKYGTGTSFIIPYDDSEIVVCSSYDIWVSFGKLNTPDYGYIPTFQKLLFNEFEKANIKVDEGDWNSLKKALTSISKTQTVIDTKGETLIKYLDKILDPKLNGFRMGIENLSKQKEVVIQGKAALVEYKRDMTFADVVKLIK